MIAFDIAREIIERHTHPLGVTSMECHGALGCVTADAIRSPCDFPRFDNSAVDGFGVRVSNLANASTTAPVSLQLCGEVAAGSPECPTIADGQTIRILTGAAVPPSVEAMVMQEDATVEDESVVFRSKVETGQHIRGRAEECMAGDVLIPAHTEINVPTVGILASAGITQISVIRRPRVGLLATGNELISPGKPLKEGQIYESNLAMLSCELSQQRIPTTVGTTKDDAESTREAIAHLINTCDVVITVGGISVGRHDYVRSAMMALKVHEHFWKIAMKPGKPNFFGTTDTGALMFGLPGNPVSALVSFRLLVRPALRRLMGLANNERFLQARLSQDIQPTTARVHFARGVLDCSADQPTVTPVTNQGSHMLSGAVAANCLIEVPPGPAIRRSGEVLRVLLDE